MEYYSDFSYLTRAIMLTYLWFYLLVHIWRSDRFASLKIVRLRRFELKSVVTLMMLTFIPFQLYYDISITCILYYEGFELGPSDNIRAKPPTAWRSSDWAFARSIDYALMIGFSFQTGTLFLLQSFWNYLAGSVTKHSFMGSKEFKLYILWSICTICMFPVIKYTFENYFLISGNHLANIVALFVYGISLFILACLGVLSHYRFKKLILMIEDERGGAITMNKLLYFAQSNDSMTIALFITSISFIIVAGSEFIPGRPLEMNKAITDTLIFNASFSTMAIWFIVIKIVHCPYQLGLSPNDPTSYIMRRPSTLISESGNYSATINMESGESTSGNPFSSGHRSRSYVLPTMANLETDYPPAPVIISPTGVASPRQSVIQPIQRPNSFRYSIGKYMEDPQRPSNLNPYLAGSQRRSKYNEGPVLFI